MLFFKKTKQKFGLKCHSRQVFDMILFGVNADINTLLEFQTKSIKANDFS